MSRCETREKEAKSVNLRDDGHQASNVLAFAMVRNRREKCVPLRWSCPGAKIVSLRDGKDQARGVRVVAMVVSRRRGVGRRDGHNQSPKE